MREKTWIFLNFKCLQTANIKPIPKLIQSRLLTILCYANICHNCSSIKYNCNRILIFAKKSSHETYETIPT